MNLNKQISVHWFRRDLRITDNPALFAATAHAYDAVVPVYFLSNWKNKHRWTGARRQEFLCGCLQALDGNLRALGGRLVLRSGPAIEAMRALLLETGATALHANRDYDLHGMKMENEVRLLCEELGVDCQFYKDAVMHEPAEIKNQQGSPYRVYTPYSKVWMSLDKQSPVGKPGSISVPEEVKSLPLPDLSWWGLSAPITPSQLEAGEKAARMRMKRALADIIPFYADRRDIPSGNTTSRLSQDLRFGLISIRELYAKVLAGMQACRDANARKGHEVYLKELAWREFYIQIQTHFPEVLEWEFNADYRGLVWDENPEALDRWKSGLTGFPLVDAGMRQLLATGFIHNRVRMIVSMFLTKDLHIDWREGERHFMQHLLDAEIASNNGGWQWSAGTGADAAPYFRIQNPWTQTKRHDPEGKYIKQWVPELKVVPAHKFMEPPADGQPIAPGYPLPMVDHSTERDETLERFKANKDRNFQ